MNDWVIIASPILISGIINILFGLSILRRRLVSNLLKKLLIFLLEDRVLSVRSKNGAEILDVNLARCSMGIMNDTFYKYFNLLSSIICISYLIFEFKFVLAFLIDKYMQMRL